MQFFSYLNCVIIHKVQIKTGEAPMLMTTTEVALRLQCSAENVRALERNRKLQAEKTANGRRIFRSEDVDRLAQERAQAKELKAARAA
jgi:excisionase family DNA binding protein